MDHSEIATNGPPLPLSFFVGTTEVWIRISVRSFFAFVFQVLTFRFTHMTLNSGLSQTKWAADEPAGMGCLLSHALSGCRESWGGWGGHRWEAPLICSSLKVSSEVRQPPAPDTGSYQPACWGLGCFQTLCLLQLERCLSCVPTGHFENYLI